MPKPCCPRLVAEEYAGLCDWWDSQPSSFVVGDNVSADLCSCWTPLDTFKGHTLQLRHQGPHKQTATLQRASVPTPVCVIASTLPPVFQCAASFKMRRVLLEHACHHRHPAQNKMSIFILHAELVWQLCYVQFPCIFFFFRFKVTKIGKEKLNVTNMKAPTAAAGRKEAAWRDAPSQTRRFRLSWKCDTLCRASLW